jgi:hypothetical protein
MKPWLGRRSWRNTALRLKAVFSSHIDQARLGFPKNADTILMARIAPKEDIATRHVDIEVRSKT